MAFKKNEKKNRFIDFRYSISHRREGEHHIRKLYHHAKPWDRCFRVSPSVSIVQRQQENLHNSRKKWHFWPKFQFSTTPRFRFGHLPSGMTCIAVINSSSTIRVSHLMDLGYSHGRIYTPYEHELTQSQAKHRQDWVNQLNERRNFHKTYE